MFTLLTWLLFGLLTGYVAKWLHPGAEPEGIVSTVGIGIIGSFVGGAINWILGMGANAFAPSGFLMSIVGGIICCVAWRWYTLKNDPEGPRSFFTGKKLR